MKNPLFVWPVRVYYEDTDSGGVVYYANYLKFMERARTEWLRSRGVEQDELVRAHDVIFAVRAAQLDYLRPARFNDLLAVSVEVTAHGRASLSFRQHVLRPPGGALHPEGSIEHNAYLAMTADKENILCAGEIKIACLTASTLRPCAIPPHLLAEIRRVG